MAWSALPHLEIKSKLGCLKAGRATSKPSRVRASAAIASARGVFLLHVFGFELEEPVPFEDMREQLMDQVYSEAIEAEMDQWYRQRRRQAAVLIKLESVEAE